MRRALLVVFVAALAVQSPAQGDVLLNEVHAFGGGAAPPFAGDVLELWNRTATPIDLQGWTVGAWAGDQGALTLKTFPTGTPLVVPPFCFFLLQESPASEAGLPLSDPALTPFVGLRVGPMPWTSGASVGAFVKDASGQNHDYVHLHRGAGAPPASPPHLAAAGVGASWNGGSVATSGAGHAHLRRLGLVDLDHAGDWAQAPTASRGTFGEYNAPSQVGVGCGPANQGLALYGHPNGLGADLVVSGIGGPTWPLQGVLFAGVDAVDLVVTSPTNPGAPFFLLVSPTVNAGHFVDPAGQRLDLGAPSLAFCDVDVFAFSSITPLCSGLVPGVFGALDGSGAYALSLPLNGLVLPDLALQAAVLDFSAPLLLRFTAATRVGFRPGYGDGRRLAIPDGVGTPAPGPSVWREVVVSGTGVVLTDLDLAVDLRHTWFGDLSLTLTRVESGTTAVLMAPGSPDDGSDLVGEYVFDDEAGTSFDAAASAAGPFVPPGSYVGDGALAVFDGLPLDGTWRVTLHDAYAADVGELVLFQLLPTP